MPVRPFTIAVPGEKIRGIRSKLAHAAITYAPDDADWQYGINLGFLRDFVRYWHDVYDWRAAERALNRHPQYLCEIDGMDIHFIHIRHPAKQPRPTLLLTHGWPGSTHEFHEAAERLAFPEHFGGDASAGFDLVIPSLPGYGFSGRPPRPIGLRRVGRIWRSLMVEHLGISRFGVQGGDMGSAVATWMANDAPENAVALHINLCFPPARSSIEADEQAWRDAAQRQIMMDGGYWIEQMTRPQTIAAALADNPVGYAAWVLEKFHFWGDATQPVERRFSRDWLITNLMIHLVNDAVTSMIWMYRGVTEDLGFGDELSVKVPTAAAIFPGDWLPWPSRAIAARTHNIVRWREMPRGGHFAALEEPVLFADDVAAFFNGIMR